MIATAGTDEKVDFCRSLGADYGVNYRSEDFVAFVDDVTNGRGVDVAFDTVGGAVTTETFRVMAFNGRHLIIGFASGIEEEERPLSIQPSIYGNFDLVGVCFAFVDSPRTTRPFGMNFLSTAQGVDIWNRILQLARAGTIRPVIGRQIEFADVPAGLEALERRETTGRTVVRVPTGPVRPDRGPDPSITLGVGAPAGTERASELLREGVVGNRREREREPRHGVVPPPCLLDPVGDAPAVRRADEAIVVGATDDEQPRLAVHDGTVGVGEVGVRGGGVGSRSEVHRTVEDQVLRPGEEGGRTVASHSLDLGPMNHLMPPAER